MHSAFGGDIGAWAGDVFSRSSQRREGRGASKCRGVGRYHVLVEVADTGWDGMSPTCFTSRVARGGAVSPAVCSGRDDARTLLADMGPRPLTPTSQLTLNSLPSRLVR